MIARRRHSERTESAGHVAPSSAAQPHRPLTLLAREALLSVRDVGSGLCSFVSTLNKVECAISGGRRIGAHARGLPKDRKSRALLGCRCMFPQDERHNEERRGRGSQGNRRWWTSWRMSDGASTSLADLTFRRLSDALHVNAQPRARNRTESRNTGSQGRRAKTLSRALDADSEAAPVMRAAGERGRRSIAARLFTAESEAEERAKSSTGQEGRERTTTREWDDREVA